MLQRMTLMHKVVKFLEKCKKFTIFRIEKNFKKSMRFPIFPEVSLQIEKG